MARTSYLRFNPETREIELEGSEEFIKAYFDKLQGRPCKASGEEERGPAAAKASPVKKAKAKAEAAATAKVKTVIPVPKKAVKIASSKAKVQTKAAIVIPAPKKVVKVAVKKATARKHKETSFIDKVVGLVQESETGMTTAELLDKTGMTTKQIWAITSRAAKLNRIKTTKRGVYVPV